MGGPERAPQTPISDHFTARLAIRARLTSHCHGDSGRPGEAVAPLEILRHVSPYFFFTTGGTPSSAFAS
jgi:hypothetical protein